MELPDLTEGKFRVKFLEWIAGLVGIIATDQQERAIVLRETASYETKPTIKAVIPEHKENPLKDFRNSSTYLVSALVSEEVMFSE